MNWNNLSGRQRKLLREAISFAFVDRDDLSMFLTGELNWPKLARIARPGNEETQISDLVEWSQARGFTDLLVATLQQSRGKNVLVRSLPDAIRAAGVEPPIRLSSPAMELERIVQGGGFADIRVWAESLANISRATCRIEYPANTPLGTGILVAVDRVLTNYHVVKRHLSGEADASKLVCRFDFASDVSGTDAGTPRGLAGGKDWIIAQSPFDPADIGGAGLPTLHNLDFALLKLETAFADRPPVDIAIVSDAVAQGLPLLIVQHPAGKPQALAIGKSLGPNENESRLRYDADTLPGSSGSGVFNQSLQLVALHHAGDPMSPVQALYNQGIPIGLIHKELTAH